MKDRHRDDFDRQCSGVVQVYVKNGENLELQRPAPPFLSPPSAVRGPIELKVSVEGVFTALWRNSEQIPAISRNLPPGVFIYEPPQPDGSPRYVYVQGEPLLFEHP